MWSHVFSLVPHSGIPNRICAAFVGVFAETQHASLRAVMCTHDNTSQTGILWLAGLRTQFVS